ncbi:MAG TPA: ECF-type sigma factor [Thermoanaerobaculia bacterium]|nr:ECF-type sigma factor [Thermoanaerobaculia bacterium]
MQSEPSREVTELLDAWSDGDREALDRLVPLVLEDLRRLARSYLSRENPGHTLQPTALVNEAFLRLIGRRQVRIESRVQFFAVLAQTMRHILVDHARRKKAARRPFPWSRPSTCRCGRTSIWSLSTRRSPSWRASRRGRPRRCSSPTSAASRLPRSPSPWRSPRSP